MQPSAVVLLEIALANPADEAEFFAWWADARSLLGERAKPLRLDLLVTARGRYTVVLETAYPGAFGIVEKDRPWKDLDARRPEGTLAARELRVWHEPLNLSTATFAAWLDERRAGTRDFVLVDALPERSFAEKHIPGSVSLPVAEITAESAARVLGAKDRTVVIYCAGYT